MSKRKDRERAESGLIHRNGEFVKKEEWYAAHLTPEMRMQRQAGVDKAVADLMGAELMSDSLDPKDADAVLAETTLAAPQGKTYFCTQCLKYHRQPNSKIYQAHMAFEDQNVPTALTENGIVTVPNQYYCTACRKHHMQTSKVGKDHTNFYLEEASNG